MTAFTMDDLQSMPAEEILQLKHPDQITGDITKEDIETVVAQVSIDSPDLAARVETMLHEFKQLKEVDAQAQAAFEPESEGIGDMDFGTAFDTFLTDPTTKKVKPKE